MPSSVRFSIFFCFILVGLVLSPSILSAHATTSYVPAVMPGNLAQYMILYDTCQSSDPSLCQSMGSGGLNDTQYAALQVIAVSGPMVTLQLITVYKNGTGSHQGVSLDVDTGYSNITDLGQGPPGDYFVLAGQLLVTDHIWDSPSAPIFNSTRTEIVLSTPRSVNFLNFSSSISGQGYSLSSSSGFAFDQASGVFIEISFSFASTTIAGSSLIKFALGMVDNNLWGTAILPDFSLSADPTTVNISGSATGTSTITLTRSNSFSATVKLTAAPSSSSITCSLSSSTLAMGGPDTSTLSCAGSPGTYAVSVSGDSGYSIHSASVSVSVAASPDFQISYSGAINFQTGGSGTATITIAAQNGFNAATTLEIVNAPSGLTCNLSNNSVSGYGSVTLTCSGQPGSYTVTVKATGGGTSHSTDTPVTVSAAPVSTQPAISLPMPFVYGGIAVAAIVATLVAFLFMRRKPSKSVVAPGDASTPAAQS